MKSYLENCPCGSGKESFLEYMRLTNPTYHFATEFAEVGG